MIPRALFTIAVTSYAVKTTLERYTWRAIRRGINNINGNPR